MKKYIIKFITLKKEGQPGSVHSHLHFIFAAFGSLEREPIRVATISGLLDFKVAKPVFKGPSNSRT